MCVKILVVKFFQGFTNILYVFTTLRQYWEIRILLHFNRITTIATLKHKPLFLQPKVKAKVLLVWEEEGDDISM
jgi:hypothetical protein